MNSPNSEKTYAERVHQKIEGSMKLNDTDRYVNNGVENKNTKEHILSGQLNSNANSSENKHTHSINESSAEYFYVDKNILADKQDTQTSSDRIEDNSSLVDFYHHEQPAVVDITFPINQYDSLDSGRNSGQKFSYSIPVVYDNSYESRTEYDSYEQRKISQTEETLKISNTEYAEGDTKEMKNTSFPIDQNEFINGSLETVQKLSDLASAVYVNTSSSILKLKKLRVHSPFVKEIFLSEKAIRQLEEIDRVLLEKKALQSYFDLNTREYLLNKQKIKYLKNEKRNIGKDGKKNQNIIGKSADAIRHGTAFAKNVSNSMKDDQTGDNTLMERSYAIAEASVKGVADMSKGLVKSVASIASIESSCKIINNSEKKYVINKQIKDLKGVNKAIKKRNPNVYATYGHVSDEKLKDDIRNNKIKKKEIDRTRKKNKATFEIKAKKDKRKIAKDNIKANRKQYIKDYTRNKIINALVKPESDRENNMSTGFASFVTVIAKRYVEDIFIGLIKMILGSIAQVIMVVFGALINIIILIIPVILPIGAVLAVVCGLFSFMFGDISGDQANELYCSTVLNNKYNDFNKSSHDWLDNNQADTTGYKVVYVDDCSGVNNFQDALLLYIIFSADNVSSGTSTSDNSYLVVDTDAENQAMDKAFSMLTYAEVDGKVRNVHRLTLADVESQLTDSQKNMLDLERNLVADGSGLNLGERNPGEYPDDVGLGSDIQASDKAQAAIDFAISKLGCPYSQALRNDGKHFDCSSLVYYAWLNAGINISPGSIGNAGTTYTESKYLEEVGQIVSISDNSELQPGDLIFLTSKADRGTRKISHVVMYIGNNQIVHAPQTGDVVKISNCYWAKDQVVEVARPN